MKKICSGIIKFIDKWIIVPVTKIFLIILNFFKGNKKEFEKFINKKQTLIILSLIFSVLVFLIIDQRTDTIINKTAEVITDQQVVAEYNKESYVIEGLPNKVDVTLIGRTADLYLAKQYTNNLIISADLRGLTPGSHKVKLNYNQSQALRTIDYKIDPSTANVVVYEKVSETRELAYDIIHKEKLDKKFVIKSVSLSRNDVIIKGAGYKLESVSNVKALIDVDKISNPKAGNYTLKDIQLIAYDSNGDKVNVEIVPETVEAQIEISSPQKEVPVQIIPKGDLAFGKSIKQLSSSVNKVTIYGDNDVLDKITSIPVEIDVTNLSDDKTYNVNIKKPTGVRDISEKTATIKVTLDQEITKEFKNIRISYEGLDESKYKAQALSQNDASVTVVVKGSSDVVNKIEESSIRAVVDLKGFTAGNYEVDVKVVGDDIKLSYESKTKKVNIRIEEN